MTKVCIGILWVCVIFSATATWHLMGEGEAAWLVMLAISMIGGLAIGQVWHEAA